MPGVWLGEGAFVVKTAPSFPQAPSQPRKNFFQNCMPVPVVVLRWPVPQPVFRKPALRRPFCFEALVGAGKARSAMTACTMMEARIRASTGEDRFPAVMRCPGILVGRTVPATICRQNGCVKFAVPCRERPRVSFGKKGCLDARASQTAWGQHAPSRRKPSGPAGQEGFLLEV